MLSIPLSDRSLAAAVTVCAALVLCLTLGSGYMPVDNDALYADVARTIVATGDWLHLDIHGVPFLDKPPAFFWVAAALSGVFGSSIGVLRLTAALCGALAAGLLSWGALRSRAGRGAALLAPLFLLSEPLFVEYCRRVYVEVPVALCVIGAVLAYEHGLHGLDGRGGRPAGYVWGGVLTGLGFMVKSLVGLFGLLPFLILVLLRRRWDVLRSPAFWGGAAAACAIVLPWHVHQLATNADAFLQFTWKLHVEDQIFDAQPWSTGPPWYYLEALVTQSPALGLLLLCGLGLVASRALRRQPVAALDWHLVLALGVMGAVFTASETKKVLYLVPLVAPAALLAARMIAAETGGRRLWVGLAAGAAVVLGLRALPLFVPSASFLRGAEPLARAAEATADRAAPDATLYTLDVYFSPVQYYGRRRAVSFWTSPQLPAQTTRIPYIRFGDNIRHLPMAEVVVTMRERLPGIWYLPEGLVNAADLSSIWEPVYAEAGVFVFDTRR